MCVFQYCPSRWKNSHIALFSKNRTNCSRFQWVKGFSHGPRSTKSTRLVKISWIPQILSFRFTSICTRAVLMRAYIIYPFSPRALSSQICLAKEAIFSFSCSKWSIYSNLRICSKMNIDSSTCLSHDFVVFKGPRSSKIVKKTLVDQFLFPAHRNVGVVR